MGFLVAYLRIPAIVVTLGMLSILKGGLISVTSGAWISDLPQGYALAQMRPLGVPMPIWFMAVLTAGAARLDALPRRPAGRSTRSAATPRRPASRASRASGRS